MDDSKEDICEECESTEEVLFSPIYYTAWGRGVGDFNWSKNEDGIALCGVCESNNWVYCDTCSALVGKDYYGVDLPDEYEGDTICPGCWEENREILFRKFNKD